MNTINTSIINGRTVWTNPGLASENLTVAINDDIFLKEYNHLPLAFVTHEDHVIYVNKAFTKTDSIIRDAILSHEVGHIRTSAVYNIADACQFHIDACEYAADRYSLDNGYAIINALELMIKEFPEAKGRLENLLAYKRGEYKAKTPFEIMLEMGHGNWALDLVSKLSYSNLIKATKIAIKLKESESKINYCKSIKYSIISKTSTYAGLVNGMLNAKGIKVNGIATLLSALIGCMGIFTAAKISAKKGFITTLLLALNYEIAKRDLKNHEQ